MGEEQRAGAGSGRLQVEREARPGGLQQRPGVLQSQEGRRGTLQMHRGPRDRRYVPRRRSERTSGARVYSPNAANLQYRDLIREQMKIWWVPWKLSPLELAPEF